MRPPPAQAPTSAALLAWAVRARAAADVAADEARLLARADVGALSGPAGDALALMVHRVEAQLVLLSVASAHAADRLVRAAAEAP